jgi:glycosyltransferase involved in cell wall biosynthesis
METVLNILFVHLLNNYSGSPHVLATILKELSLKKDYHISLLTSNQEGCLSGIANIVYYNNHYKWSNNKGILLIRFIFAQIYTFFFIILKSKGIDIVYINTILPFTAALAGFLVHKKIIYHVHEVYVRPNVVQTIMRFTAERYAHKIFVVSHYVGANINRASRVLYNTVSREFERDAQKSLNDTNMIRYKYCKKNILMVSSLKKYKGIDVFVSLAIKCKEYSFSLVVSSPQADIIDYFSYISLPGNLTIIPQQKDLLPHYRDASIVVNLSLPDLWVETFGMTLLEGLQCGTPCVAPNFGGPKEIVLNGINGILVNPYNEESIISAINSILYSEERYTDFVINALKSMDRFSIDSAMRLWYEEIYSVVSETSR